MLLLTGRFRSCVWENVDPIAAASEEVGVSGVCARAGPLAATPIRSARHSAPGRRIPIVTSCGILVHIRGVHLKADTTFGVSAFRQTVEATPGRQETISTS